MEKKRIIKLEDLNKAVEEELLKSPFLSFFPKFYTDAAMQEDKSVDRKEDTYIQGCFNSNIGENRDRVVSVLSKFFERFDYSYCGHHLWVSDRDIIIVSGDTIVR